MKICEDPSKNEIVLTFLEPKRNRGICFSTFPCALLKTPVELIIIWSINKEALRITQIENAPLRLKNAI